MDDIRKDELEDTKVDANLDENVSTKEEKVDDSKDVKKVAIEDASIDELMEITKDDKRLDTYTHEQLNNMSDEELLKAAFNPTNEEEEKVYELLRKNNFNHEATIEDIKRQIFTISFCDFIAKYFDIFKYMLTTDKTKTKREDFYKIKIDSTYYYFKEEYFKIHDYYENSIEGRIELYVLNTDKISSELLQYDIELFNDAATHYQNELQRKGDNETIIEPKDARELIAGLAKELGDKVNVNSSDKFYRNKYSDADKTAVDLAFSGFDKILEDYNYAKSFKKAQELNLINGSRITKVNNEIKKVYGNYYKKKDLLDGTRETIMNLAEILYVIFTHTKEGEKENLDLNKVIELINKEDKKKVKRNTSTFIYVVASSLYRNLKSNEVLKNLFPSLLNSYANKNVEDSYVIKKFYEISEKIIKANDKK
nr:MAG TPA: hypothetical protein [Caudoviricetes sp.]